MQVRSLVVLLGFTLCLFISISSRKTVAQQVSENGLVYEAGRNKIGLIQYCRNNELIDPTIANQAVTAVESGLPKLPLSDYAKEQGDRAQQAGEDGFWDSGRRRGIASVADQFRTTPADLCQEWANETLRAEALTRLNEVRTITEIVPILPNSQAHPIQVDKLARANVVATAGHLALHPPLPEKAPAIATEAEVASLRGALPTRGRIGRAKPGHMSGAASNTTNALPPSRRAMHLSARLASKSVEPPHRPKRTVSTAVQSRRNYERPHLRQKHRPFNRLWKPRRCLLPGCRWPTLYKRHPSQY